MMLIGKPLSFRNKNSRFMVDMRLLMLVNDWLYFLVGQGAYGIVVAAKDKQASDKTKELVAIKKIDKAFEHKIFAKRTLRELRLLKLLKHENIINIETIILPKSREEF